MKKIVSLIVLCALVVACTLPPNFQGGANPFPSLSQILAGPGATIPPALAGVFLKAPYNVNAPLNNQYPRVAFTVLSSPPNHSELVSNLVLGGGAVPPACWQLSARIWSSPKTSKDSGPFTLCMPGILSVASGIPLRGFEEWCRAEQTLYRPTPGQQTTGERRTLGPIPPDTIFPGGVRYLGYYGGLGEPFPITDTEEGYMWACLLYGMGFDWQKKQDRRIWIYKYNAVEP
jgi:hypothetical protein